LRSGVFATGYGRIRRLSLGNPGDVKPVGSGVSEMRNAAETLKTKADIGA